MTSLNSICRHCARGLLIVKPSRPSQQRQCVRRARSIHTKANQSSRLQRPRSNNVKHAASRRQASGSSILQEVPFYSVNDARVAPREPVIEKRVLAENDLFHPYSKSPIPDMQRRAAYIKQHAFCPHPDHQATRIPDNGQPMRQSAVNSPLPAAHVDFECPDCGVPVYCSEGHWQDDYEAHLEICDTLRQVNEDDHDLRSGRLFPEFLYEGEQLEEAAVNMTNWDTFMYTRNFTAVNADRSMRQVTRMLTYPITIASILHELSPYSLRQDNRLTPEGLKSFSALRYTLHPPRTGEGSDIKGLRLKAPAVRIFVLGARAESSLPRDAWAQLGILFPRASFHVVFIGPDSMANRDDEFPLPQRTAANPFSAVVEDQVYKNMKISTIVDYYHTIHQTGYFEPYDPYFDCFVLFHPGLGHPTSSHEWSETIPMLLDTKAPIICTGYTQHDMERDIDWVSKTASGEFDILMTPGQNNFRSLRWDLNDQDPQDLSCGNWGVWAFRGKRYETTTREAEES